MLERWWCTKYRRPPNHPLLLERSVAELEQEMLEDLHVQREEVRDKLAEADGNTGQLLRQLNALNEALGDAADAGKDDLVDKWDAELDAGRTPNLDEG